ncbi:MAG: tetratricopeptide repeat protein, partial [Planctomycetes bacterium]|nr:tetratricopeptide repeat protein [Planctomycetota bacterium]
GAATDYLEQSLVSSRIIGDKRGIYSALINLGTAAYYQEDYALARNYFEQVLDAYLTGGIREQEAVCLYKLGQVTMAQGDLLRTRDYFEQSLVFSRSTTTGTLLPETLSNLAIIYLLLHQEALASATLRESVEAAGNFAVSHVQFWPLVAATRMWIIKGKPLQAATWLGLVENHAHPAIKMADIQRVIQAARAECVAALSPEQFAAAWEEGKNLDVDTVIADILREL